MLNTVAEIVFRMISLIFKGIEIFVFNFPSGASSFDEDFDICLINRDIGYPTAVESDPVTIHDGIFKVIYIFGLPGFI